MPEYNQPIENQKRVPYVVGVEKEIMLTVRKNARLTGKPAVSVKKENHFRKVCRGKASTIKKEPDDQATTVDQSSDGTDSSVEALVHGIFELSGIHSIPSTNLVWDNSSGKVWVLDQ